MQMECRCDRLLVCVNIAAADVTAPRTFYGDRFRCVTLCPTRPVAGPVSDALYCRAVKRIGKLAQPAACSRGAPCTLMNECLGSVTFHHRPDLNCRLCVINNARHRSLHADLSRPHVTRLTGRDSSGTCDLHPSAVSCRLRHTTDWGDGHVAGAPALF